MCVVRGGRGRRRSLVELRLRLVAEVEEGEEEDRQEESWEVESGEDQREERTLTWMAMQME